MRTKRVSAECALLWVTMAVAACGGSDFQTAPGGGTSGTDGGGPAGATSSGGSSQGGSTSTGGATQGGSTSNGGTAQGGAISGSGGSFGSGGSSSVTETGFYAALVSVICPSLVRCCSPVGLTFDESRCESVLDGVLAKSVNGAPTGTYRFDASMATQCLDGARAGLGQTCDSVVATNVPACQNVFVGTLPPGAPCTTSAECQHDSTSKATCSAETDGGMACAVELHVHAGDACTETCTAVGPATGCSGTISGVSVRRQCFTNDGLHCSNGSCTAQSTVGGPCTDSNACGGETRCSFQTHTCIARTALGGSCTSDLECRTDLFCQNGVCAQKEAVGTTCTSTSQCAGGVCSQNKCTAISEGVGVLCAVVVNGGAPGGPFQ